MQSVNMGRSQFMKARLLLAENKLDDLVALLSEHIEGIQGQKLRDAARKETKCKNKVAWGLLRNCES